MGRNMLDYVPTLVSDYKEIRSLIQSEQMQFEFIESAIASTLNNAFILDCDSSGIVHFESMLDITSDNSKTLEERRQIVLNRWNRRLPYTIRVLEDLVSSTVGTENVKIKIQEYNLNLILLNQSTDLIREIRKTVGDMIPANMIFLMVGKYINKALLQIETDTLFTMNTEFYPRDNTEYLTLNGTWSLNDKYTINGYKSDKPVDFYPVGMQLSTFIKNNVGLVSLQTYCTDLKTETSSKVCYQIKSDCNINTKEDISIAIHTFVSKDIKSIAKQTYYTDLKVDLASSSENSIKTEYKVKAERENIVLIRSSSNIRSKVTSNVTVAKNVWKLDGSYRLDGSRIIPEKSKDYML